MFFDPVYFIFIAPALLLTFWAKWKVSSTYKAASQMVPASGASGAEAAAVIIRQTGMPGVQIEQTEGFLSDHYDPRHKVLRLSPDVYNGRSLAALGIAAHEAGHALQDASGYPLLKLRNGIVPLAAFGGNFSMILLLAGIFMSSFNLLIAGIALFSITVLFQIINLPVEFDASRRAKELLLKIGLVKPEEAPAVNRVLSAAAMTYVAATLMSVLTLVYYLFRAGLLGGRSDDEA